jgi:hypothetical protein
MSPALAAAHKINSLWITSLVGIDVAIPLADCPTDAQVAEIIDAAHNSKYAVGEKTVIIDIDAVIRYLIERHDRVEATIIHIEKFGAMDAGGADLAKADGGEKAGE